MVGRENILVFDGVQLRGDLSVRGTADESARRNFAPTVNCTNTYPVLDRWRKLDPRGENIKLYNRYAHIEIIFDSGATNFDIHLDKTILTLNPADLPKLDVRYILSPHGDLEKFSTAAVKINKLFADAGTFIYKVN